MLISANNLLRNGLFACQSHHSMLKSPGGFSGTTVELLAHKEDEKRTQLLFWSGAT